MQWCYYPRNAVCEFRTPLHAAAHGNHCVCLQMLLDNNADVNKADVNGRTPLMYAAMNGQSNALGVILRS